MPYVPIPHLRILAFLAFLGCLGSVAPSDAEPPEVSAEATAAYASAAAFQDRGLYGLAGKEWRAFLLAFPDASLVSRARYNLGVCQFQEGDFSSAVKQFEEVADPTRHGEIAEAAIVSLGLARFNLAREEIEESPENANASFRSAIEAFDALLEAYPTSDQAPQSRLYRAESLAAVDDHRAAITEYKRFLAEARGESLHPFARLAMGKSQWELGDAEQAEATLTELLEEEDLGDLAPEAHRLRGEIRLADQRYDEAATDFARAAAVKRYSDADYAKDREAFAYYGKEDYAQAAKTYSELTALFPDSELVSSALLSAGKCASLAGNHDDAIKYFRRITTLGPDTEASHCLAQALLRSGKPAEAEAVAKRALGVNALNSWKADLELDLAESLDAQPDKREEALSLYSQLATAQPDHLAGRRAAYLAPHTALELGAVDRATELAERYLKQYAQSEQSPDLLALLVEAHSMVGRNQLVIATATSLLREHPESHTTVRALYQRGMALTRMGHTQRADEDFDRIVTEFGENALTPLALYAIASNQFARDQFQDCETTLRSLLNTGNPGPRGEAAFLLATTLQKQGRFDDALQSLQQAKAPEPNRFYLQGQCEAGKGRIALARQAYEQLLQRHGEHELADDAVYELAWIDKKDQQPESARRRFLRLASQYDTSPFAVESWFRAGEIDYSLRQFTDSASHFLKAVENADPSSSLHEQSLHLAGWSLFESNDKQRALRLFERQLAEHPKGPLAADAQLMAGECHHHLGQTDAALAAYDAAFRNGGGSNDLRRLAQFHAGQAAAQLGDWRRSFDLLDQASREPFEGDQASDFQNEQVAYERAWAMVNLGRREEARPIFERLARKDLGPLAARSQFMLGELQFADKQYGQAVRTFFRVAYGYGGVQAPAEFHPWQSEALFEAARCLEELDRSVPAKKLYAELVERFPESPKARLAKQRLQMAARP